MTDPVSKAASEARAALAQSIDASTGLDLMTLSTVMVQSGFFPNTESVAQGVVKILAGRELGFPTIASMRHIYVHNGHIGLQATLIATQIRRSGIYDYKIMESSDSKCEIEFLRFIKPNNEWRTEGRASFTIEEARRAGLIKERSAWQTYPSDLLFARAMTRGQRRYCPDVFGQMVYSEEEVRDIASAEPKPVGSQTIEDRIAEMMPREKQPSADDTPAGPAEHAPVTADAPPSQDSTPASPTSSGESGSEAAAGGQIVPGNDGEQPGQWSLPAGQPVQEQAMFTAREQDDKAEQPDLPDLPAGQPVPARTVKFSIGKQQFETAGITRKQMVYLFDICHKVGKKYGAAKLREVLVKEFGVEHRADLTEEQAERYTIRMLEMAGIE